MCSAQCLAHVCVHAKLLQSCLTLYDPMDYSLPASSVHGDSSGKNAGVGCHALLQGIFPTHLTSLVSSSLAGRFFITVATWESFEVEKGLNKFSFLQNESVDGLEDNKK